MFFIECDNAMGSVLGDVDDGFALAALLKSKLNIEAIASVFGNTSERKSFLNNRKLAQLCGYQGIFLHGAKQRGELSCEAAHFLSSSHDVSRVLCLGPLTTLAAVAWASNRWQETIILGSSIYSQGKYPPLWPFEFNLVKDRGATVKVFNTISNLTVIPIDVAKRFQVSARELSFLTGELGTYLYKKSRRWIWRSRILKLKNSFPIWDLIAAMYCIDPSLFETRQMLAKAHGNGHVEYGIGRQVRVIVAYDKIVVWNAFKNLISQPP